MTEELLHLLYGPVHAIAQVRDMVVAVHAVVVLLVAVVRLFGVGRRRSDFDYDAATRALTQAENASKSASRPAASPLRSPSAAGTAAAASGFGFPAAAASPSKIPPGFS